MSPHDIFNWAVNLPYGSPQQQAAEIMCNLRGVNPLDYGNTPFGPCTQWQAVAFEARLMTTAGTWAL